MVPYSGGSFSEWAGTDVEVGAIDEVFRAAKKIGEGIIHHNLQCQKKTTIVYSLLLPESYEWTEAQLGKNQ